MRHEYRVTPNRAAVPRMENAVINLTLTAIIFLMLTYIVTTEQNIRRYRKIMEELP